MKEEDSSILIKFNSLISLFRKLTKSDPKILWIGDKEEKEFKGLTYDGDPNPDCAIKDKGFIRYFSLDVRKKEGEYSYLWIE
jgi:hypothetical protein